MKRLMLVALLGMIGCAVPARNDGLLDGRLRAVSTDAHSVLVRNETGGPLKFEYTIAYYDESGRRWFHGVRRFERCELGAGEEKRIEGRPGFARIGLETRPAR